MYSAECGLILESQEDCRQTELNYVDEFALFSLPLQFGDCKECPEYCLIC